MGDFDNENSVKLMRSCNPSLVHEYHMKNHLKAALSSRYALHFGSVVYKTGGIVKKLHSSKPLIL